MKLFTLFLILAALCQAETKKTDSYTSATADKESTTIAECKILIAMKYSYFEKMVLQNIIDSLKLKKCTVKDIDIESFDKFDKSPYQAILLFSAIKSKGPIAPVKSYVEGGEKGANIFVCRIYGDLWEEGAKVKKVVDAVSAATTSLQPSKVASKIIANLKIY